MIQSKSPWLIAIAIWLVYGTAALTEGLIVFHPHSPLTRAVFQSFADGVDAAYRGDPFGDNLHKAFALVDTFFAPVFWAAGVGLVRKKPWGRSLAFACALTSLALLTTDLCADAFAGFRNVLSPWSYGAAFVPYYLVVGSTLAYVLRRGLDAPAGIPPTTDHTPGGNAPPAARRALAFLVDAGIALVLSTIGSAGWILAVAYLLLRDGLAGGSSLGKRLFGLRVILTDGSTPAGLIDSVRRNVIFAIPLLNAGISAAVFEGVLLHFDEDGRRLGDRIAGTRVRQE